LMVEEIDIPGAPALQSYAVGQHNGRWLMMGGRISGLHGHNPFNSFPPDSANAFVWMVDPVSGQVWSAPVTTLSAAVARQLLATNLCFHQKDSLLYLIGGYGYDASTNQYDTWPSLTVVNLRILHDALAGPQPISTAFTHLSDSRMAVTGGQLGMDGDLFYLVGGQKFTGRYNPHGNPSYTQTYTEAIRTFRVTGGSTSPVIQDYSEITDSQELHRRDYNMAEQIFPDGSYGFTAFSGVFRHNVDLPWHNVVNINDQTYEAIPEANFSQLYNQYHGAKMSVYDPLYNEMHTVFFGGIGMYDWDTLSLVSVVDSAVPFVRTISVVTRFPDSSMGENVLPARMPGLLGASAEFIPNLSAPHFIENILDLEQIGYYGTNVGHIFGGIESSQPNIFMQATGSSHATNRAFRVMIARPPHSIPERGMLHRLPAVPNPAGPQTRVYLPWESRDPQLKVLDLLAKEHLIDYRLEGNQLTMETSQLIPGVYFLWISESGQDAVAKLVVQR
ncbi:MAG: hypothetical protein IH599_00865, partial [Bacteroidales bacterium]|nr:hypothetical protein [Bacteroidales bacterium]